MSTPDQQRAVAAEVIVRAWRDDAYRDALLADPAGTLQAAGVALPEHVSVTLLEDVPGVSHVAIPRDMRAQESADFATELAQRLPLPDGSELRLRQSARHEFIFVLPLPPDGANSLTEDLLDLVVGGGNGGNGGFFDIVGLGGNGGNGGNGGAGLIG